MILHRIDSQFKFTCGPAKGFLTKAFKDYCDDKINASCKTCPLHSHIFYPMDEITAYKDGLFIILNEED